MKWILTSAVLAIASVLSPAVAAKSCPPREGANTPPPYPADGPKRNAEVVLLIATDRCGIPTSVDVEWTSGYASLDAAATQAARRWRFDETNTTVRIPVAYAGHGAGAPTALSQIARDYPSVVAAVCRMQVPPVTANGDGTLPGFIADPAPFGFDSVAEVEAMLARDAVRELGSIDKAGGRGYLSGTKLEWVRWRVFKGDWVFAPSVMKQRSVHDGSKAFVATSGLCGAADPAKCERFEAFLRDFNKKPQRATEGPPSMPNGDRCP